MTGREATFLTLGMFIGSFFAVTVRTVFGL